MHALRICELWKGAEEHRFASLLSLCLSPPPLCVLLQLLLRHSSEWVLRRASVGPNTHYTSWRHIVFLPLRSSYFHRTRSGLHFCILRTHTSEEQMEVRATEIFSAFFIASVCWMLIISDAFVSVPTRRRHLPRMLFAFAMLVCVLRTYFNEYRAPRFFFPSQPHSEINWCLQLLSRMQTVNSPLKQNWMVVGGELMLSAAVCAICLCFGLRFRFSIVVSNVTMMLCGLQN